MPSEAAEKDSVFKPFGPRALAWAALIDAAVRAGETTLNVPIEYSSVYSILAGQGVEAGRMLIQRAREYSVEVIANMDFANPPDDVPSFALPHLKASNVVRSVVVLDEAEAKWQTAVSRTIKNNPFGLRAGPKPIDFL